MKETNIKDHIYTTIYKWVAKNFGQTEADDPSWSIEALAEDLTTSGFPHEMWEMVERNHIRADFETCAKERGIYLTKAELDVLTDEYLWSEQYLTPDYDILADLIESTTGKVGNC